MRVAVDLPKAYRLLNHGPTVLVGAQHGGRANAMACAWVMPLDFDPPKVAIVIDRKTFTRSLIEASGRFALSIPCVAQVRMVSILGTHTGHESDKLHDYGVELLDEPKAQSPLIAGCVGWLDCECLPAGEMPEQHDLFVAKVTAAWANSKVFSNGRWHFGPGEDKLRTLHHVAGGHYFASGQAVDGHHVTEA